MEEKLSALDPETIRALVRLMEENGLTELTVEDEDFSVTLKADGVAPTVVAPLPAPATAPEATPDDGLPRAYIRAPMTGTFYRAPSPTEHPFIEVGDHVEVGQVIGLIEAMKVFSEVPADVAGRVVEIPARNGELVHQDQTLVVVIPEE